MTPFCLVLPGKILTHPPPPPHETQLSYAAPTEELEGELVVALVPGQRHVGPAPGLAGSARDLEVVAGAHADLGHHVLGDHLD